MKSFNSIRGVFSEARLIARGFTKVEIARAVNEHILVRRRDGMLVRSMIEVIEPIKPLNPNEYEEGQPLNHLRDGKLRRVQVVKQDGDRVTVIDPETNKVEEIHRNELAPEADETGEPVGPANANAPAKPVESVVKESPDVLGFIQSQWESTPEASEYEDPDGKSERWLKGLEQHYRVRLPYFHFESTNEPEFDTVADEIQKQLIGKVQARSAGEVYESIASRLLSGRGLAPKELELVESDEISSHLAKSAEIVSHCPQCNSLSEHVGHLGGRSWFRCKTESCRWEYSQ